MVRLLFVRAGLFALTLGFTASAFAQAPGGIEVACDVDRVAFRTLVRSETDVTFRLWDAATGGSQCGPDYVVSVNDLAVFKHYTDRARTADPVALQRRKALRVTAVLGNDAVPVQLCSGQATWLDVSIGTATVTCDYSAQAPQSRRRLHAVPFVREPTTGTGTVTSVGTGAGLSGGPITTSGTMSVDAPTCTGTDKLTWTGTAFQCAPDQTGGGGSGTVTSVGSGPGLTGGPITSSGSLSVDAPTCASDETLGWTGAAFQCLAIPPASDVQCSSCVCTSDIGDGCITGAKIADGTITGDDIQDGSITASDLQSGSSRNGVTTRPGDAASGTQTISHGLSGTPRVVRIFAAKQSGTGFSNGLSFLATSQGTFDSSGTSSVQMYMTNTGSGNSTNSSTNIVEIWDTGGFQEATCAVDGTNITLSWTKNASPTPGNIQIHWWAQL